MHSLASMSAVQAIVGLSCFDAQLSISTHIQQQQQQQQQQVQLLFTE